MSFEPLPLSRKEKLLAERVIQIGNIVESIRERFDHSNTITSQCNSVTTLEQSTADLAGTLQTLTTTLSGMVTQQNYDPTPDDITDVMDHLGINYQGAISKGNVVVSATKPPDPTVGLVWIDPETLSAYMYNDDGDSKQWVEIR